VEQWPVPQSKFTELLFLDAHAIKPKAAKGLVKSFLLIVYCSETLDMGFMCVRDTLMMTSKRCLVIGMNSCKGNQLQYKSLDQGTEIEIWTNISKSSDNKFEQDLRASGVDILVAHTYLSDKTLAKLLHHNCFFNVFCGQELCDMFYERAAAYFVRPI